MGNSKNYTVKSNLYGRKDRERRKLYIYILTWDDLQYSVFSHVGRQISGSHVLLHYADVCQLLKRFQNIHYNFKHLITS